MVTNFAKAIGAEADEFIKVGRVRLYVRMHLAQKVPPSMVMSRMSMVDSLMVPFIVSLMLKGIGRESGKRMTL